MRGFGELEAAVMERLWSRAEPTTVREILTDLNLNQQRQLAYTTVLTVMENLHRKGWLRRQPAGRANRYSPIGTREQYVAGLMGGALDDSSDRAEALMHFVGGMTLADAAALRRALNAYQRKISGG